MKAHAARDNAGSGDAGRRDAGPGDAGPDDAGRRDAAGRGDGGCGGDAGRGHTARDNAGSGDAGHGDEGPGASVNGLATSWSTVAAMRRSRAASTSSAAKQRQSDTVATRYCDRLLMQINYENMQPQFIPIFSFYCFCMCCLVL